MAPSCMTARTERMVKEDGRLLAAQHPTGGRPGPVLVCDPPQPPPPPPPGFER